MMEASNFSPKLIADIDSSGSISWVIPDALKSYENSDDGDSCEVPFNVTMTTQKPPETSRKPESFTETNGYAFQVMPQTLL